MNRAMLLALPALMMIGACAQREESAPVEAADSATQPVATVRQVMLGLTIPASDLLFQIADNEPQDDTGWENVIATAAMLAESGNLLLTGPRDIGQPEWRELAGQLVERSKEAMDAAGRHDVDAVLEAGNALYETCENCHLKYLPKPQDVSPQP